MKADSSLQLPAFNVPDLPPKKPSGIAYHAWLLETRRRLQASGELERLLARPERRPVDVRFSLGPR